MNASLLAALLLAAAPPPQKAKELAARCALNGWCYWTLRKEGKGVKEATAALRGHGVSAKNEILFRHGINFNDLPAWQRRGVGLYWEEYEKEGYDPREQKSVTARRRRVKVDRELPVKEDYAALLRRLMGGKG